MPSTIQQFENIPECATALAHGLAKSISDKLAASNRASLVLSGGNSPKEVLPQLAASDVDWSRVDVLLSDERWVPEDHEDSNARMIKEHFLERGAAKATFHPMWVDTETPESGLAQVQHTVSKVAQPFDVAYLGMGPDGHFASLFPGDSVSTFEAEASCVVLGCAPSEPRQRISLTLSAFLETQTIFLHVTGTEKRAVFDRAQTMRPSPACPISLLLHLYPRNLQIFAA